MALKNTGDIISFNGVKSVQIFMEPINNTVCIRQETIGPSDARFVPDFQLSFCFMYSREGAAADQFT